MTMKSKLTAIVISALTLTATASDHHDEKKGPKAKPAKAEGKRKLPPHMAKFDKNKDGKLCEAERKVAAAFREMLLKKFDKDGDGKLNSEERKAAIKATEAMKAKAERRKNAKKSKGEGKLPKGAKGKKKPTPKK